MRIVARRLAVAGALMGLALALFLVVAPFATAQTDTPTDPPVTDPIKRPPVTDPPPATDPPVTTPPATKAPVVSPPPAPAPAPRIVTPPSGNSSLGRTTTTTKPKNSKQSVQSVQSQQSVVTPDAGATATTASPTTAAAADPAQPPATDPLVKVAGKEVSRQATSAQLIAAGPDSGGNDSTLTTVLLIGAVAVLPIVGAVALTGRDGGKWLRGARRDA